MTPSFFGTLREQLTRQDAPSADKPRRPVCTHAELIQEVTPSAEGCEECLQLGDTWVHLRICLICGHVGCCENSKNQHASRHHDATGHPLIQSFEPGESWVWCYVDRTFLKR